MNKAKKTNFEWLAEDGITDVQTVFNETYDVWLKHLQQCGCYGMADFITTARITQKYLFTESATYASIAKEESVSVNCVINNIHEMLFKMKLHARNKNREAKVSAIYKNLDSIENLAKQVVSPRRAGVQITDLVQELREALKGVNL